MSARHLTYLQAHIENAHRDGENPFEGIQGTIPLTNREMAKAWLYSDGSVGYYGYGWKMRIATARQAATFATDQQALDDLHELALADEAQRIEDGRLGRWR